ncbi:DNA uptake protein ComE1, partial [Mannheimia haemolytica PHL213]
KAQAIVDYRTKNGNFKNIEQLAEVSGIGQATVEKNRANIILE